MNFRKGFTLAETLVSMGILALVAAIALPSLMHTKPNQEMIMLKKVYYMTGRLVNELINDDDFYPDDTEEASSGFSNTNPDPPAKYHGRTYEGDTKFCGLFAARMNIKDVDANCSAGVTAESTFVAHSAPGPGHFTTADSVVWVLPIGSFAGADNGKSAITVDVNGDRPGNCFVTDENCSKPDRFTIYVDRWGKIYVDDDLTRTYLTTTDTTKSYEDLKDKLTSAPEPEPKGDD